MKPVTVEKAAEQLGTTEQHVRRLIKNEKIGAVWNGTAWEVDPKSVRKYARERRPAGRPVGAISNKPARSKKFGKGTPRAEHEREYQREYRRDYRAGIRRRSP